MKLQKIVFLFVFVILFYSSCSQQTRPLPAVIREPITTETLTLASKTWAVPNTPTITSPRIPVAWATQQNCEISLIKLKEVSISNKEYVSSISLDRKSFFISNPDQITTYNTSNLQVEAKILTGDKKVMAVSPNGEMAVSQNKNTLSVWSIATGAQKAVFEIPNYFGENLFLAFSPAKNELAAHWGTAEHGSQIAVWDTNTGKLLWNKPFPGFTAGLDIAYSPNGNEIINGAAYSRNIYIWDAQNGDLKYEYTEYLENRHLLEMVSSVIFSESGTLFAFGTGHVGEGISLSPVLVFDARTYKKLHSFDEKRYMAYSLSISPDDKLIAAGTADGAVLIWDIKTGKQTCVMLFEKDVYAYMNVYFVSSNSFIVLSTQHNATTVTGGNLSLWSIAR